MTHADTSAPPEAEPESEATRIWREAMAHPVGTVAVVEGRTAILIGKDDGPRRWQWLNGDWTSIPLGHVETFGHVRDLITPTERAGT